MHPFHMLLTLFIAVSLIGFLIYLRWERRYFGAKGKARGWLVVRVSTLPIAAATAAIVILPAQSTSGMEGLAAFYILLLTIAPVFWFGSHWVVGKLAKPPMAMNESAFIAASPVGFLVAAAMVAHALQPFAWWLLRLAGAV